MDNEQGNTSTATAPPASPTAGAAPAPAAAAAGPAAAAPGSGLEVQGDRSADNTRIPLEQMKAESWGTKVYHGVLNALGGSSDVALARDPATGKMVATAVKSGPGQQWKRIISGALTGAAAAAGAGPGPGGPARGFGLGFQAVTDQRQQQQRQQRHNADEDYEAMQKAVTSQAQNALLSHQIAASTFALERSKVEASTADADRETNFVKTIAEGGEGSQDMGVFPDFPSVVKAFKEMPMLHDHQAGGRLITTLHVGADGKVDGVHAALVTPDWLSSKINKDLPVTVKQMVDGKLQESTFTIPAGSLTGDQYSKLVMGQSKEAVDEYAKINDEKRKDQELKNNTSRTQAENAASYASADESRAKAAQARSATTDDATVDLIGTGQIDAGRMSYLLSRNPALVEKVAQKYPGFDNSKVARYAKASIDFTSTKPTSAGGALNAGGTVLTHLQNLAKLNTVQSHIPGTPDWNAYHNQLDTLVGELGRFYQNDTIPALKGYRATLGSNLPNTRMAAIRTQAHSMSSKFDSYVQSWKNAAPSKAYEPKMPGITPGAIAALKELDPEYPESKVAELEGMRAGQAASGADTGAAQLPAEAVTAVQSAKGQPVTFANGQTWKWDGSKAVQVTQ